MARRPVKPIFPLKYEFDASLDRFIREAGMLADAVQTALNLKAVDEDARDTLQERLDAFAEARGGDANGENDSAPSTR
jgi:hypothetical protein